METNSAAARLLLALQTHPDLTEAEWLYCVSQLGPDPWQWLNQINQRIDLRRDLQQRLRRLLTLDNEAFLYDIFPHMRDLEIRLKRAKVTILAACDALYPDSLRHLIDRPPLLYCQGQVALLHLPQIAMVGSRKASLHGEKTAFEFARQFCLGGFVVTSGLAMGIDAASHRGAIAANGNTIAVMGRGLAEIYPRSNRQLAAEILATGGLLISEFAFDMPAIKYHFPRRNRIITGMCQALLVVEASLRSGSLVSARLAAEQGKEVCAIPGSIYSQVSEGCLAIIKQGAQMVTEPRDVVATINVYSDELSDAIEISDEARTVFEILAVEPVPIDFIVRKTGWKTNKILSLLCECELAGIVSKRDGQFVRIA